MHFLSSCTPDHQPPLLLPVGEEEHKNAMGDCGDFNMDFMKSEGLLQDNINKKLTTGDAAFDELGAKHGPNWLKGRCVKSGMGSSKAPTGTCMNDLTAKIKESLASEFEEKLKKVEAGVEQKMQLKLALALKKLGEDNPDIKIDFKELCEVFTTLNDDDTDGTPITGGSSFLV